MSSGQVPEPNVARADADGFYVECPACREFVQVELVEHDLGVEEGTGRSLGAHAEPDMAAYHRHYREAH